MPSRRSLPADTLITALVYTRVSSDEQAREGVSLDAQLATCRRYAAAQGFVLGPEFQDVLSGSKDQRPAYQALLTAVRQRALDGQAVAVVVARLDRFGRHLMEQLRCREEFQHLGVAVHFVNQNGVVPELVANLLASVAQEEVRQLGERVAAAREHIARGGWWSGGQPPWSYRLRDATREERALGAPLRVLELDPEAAPFAAEAVLRFRAGASLHAITRWVATLPPAARAGRQMGYTRVRDWLLSEAPRGFVRGQPARWPAVISPEDAAAIDARAAGWAAGRRQASGRYLLTGLLRCPRCGTAMVGGPGDAQHTARYRCNQWRRTQAPYQTCSFGVPIAQTDALVLEAVSRRLAPLLATDRAAIRAQARRWQQRAQVGPTPTAQAQQQALERTRAQAQRRLVQAATLYVDGELDRAGYDGVRLEAEATLAQVGAQLAVMPVPAPARLPELARVRTIAQAWSVLAAQGQPDEVRPVLLELLARVVPERTGFRTWAVAVEWTELGQALDGITAL